MKQISRLNIVAVFLASILILVGACTTVMQTAPAVADPEREALIQERSQLEQEQASVFREIDAIEKEQGSLPRQIETEQDYEKWKKMREDLKAASAKLERLDRLARDYDARVNDYNRRLAAEQDRSLRVLQTLSDIEANDAAIEANKASAKANEALARALNPYGP